MGAGRSSRRRASASIRVRSMSSTSRRAPAWRRFSFPGNRPGSRSSGRHDSYHDRFPAARGRAGARRAVLRGAGAGQFCFRRKAGPQFSQSARAGRGGARHQRLGGQGNERDAGARVDAVLRSGAGSFLLHAAARVARGGRVTTAVAERFPVRVMVTPVWETVPVQVDDNTTVTQLKHEALRAALKTTHDEQAFVVKFRGATVLDESTTLRALGAVPKAPFVVLPARRR